MEAFGLRTVLVAAALHALLSKSQGGNMREIADEAVTAADECLDLMALDRKGVYDCTRADGHDGPCNGLPRAICQEGLDQIPELS